MSRRRGTQHRRRRPPERRCRGCGCTQAAACPGGCWWAAQDLCSSCARVERGVDAMPAPAPGLERAACGCLIGTVADVFVIEPCHGRCDLLRYTVRQSAKIGHPIEVLDLSDVAL